MVVPAGDADPPASTPAMASPPSSSNGQTKKKGKKKTSKPILRRLAEILGVLFVCELYVWCRLTSKEAAEMERFRDLGGNTQSKHKRHGVDWNGHHADALRREFQGGGEKSNANTGNNANKTNNNANGLENDRQFLRQHLARVKQHARDGADAVRTKMEIAASQRLEERKAEKEAEKLLYEAFIEKHKDTRDANTTERLKTAKKLAHMQAYTGYDDLDELPMWSQIEENFGIPFGLDETGDDASTKDDEPIILGLEHCEAFRKATDPRLRGVGPAGLFSTGTNLINQLTRSNCRGPAGQTGLSTRFALVQVPWGKHNPADARFHHQVKAPKVADRKAILPVVAIRHPYTWMAAMCKHSYNTRWRHVPHACYRSLFLKNPVIFVPWGFKEYNETHKVKNTYDNLAKMWLDWYEPYFLADRHHQVPRLMVRHEDMVYRPEKVVEKICECVGGTLAKNDLGANTNASWATDFEYEEESANRGKGHGRHGRSGLLEAVIKYATPLEEWYSQFSTRDKEILREVFFGPQINPELRTIFDVFGYKMFDHANPTTPAEEQRNRDKYVAKLTPKQMEAFVVQQRWVDGPPQQKKTKDGKSKNIKIDPNLLLKK